MRFGSVCSGIEAASVAWDPLGWEAAWFSEIDPFPCAVLKHRFPEVPNLWDMSTLPERILSGAVEAPDLLCGGTPCQAFSVAGKRLSLDDDRGNLSLVFCRIADAIDSVRAIQRRRPSIVFWENVPGVLNTRDNAFGCFLGELVGADFPLQSETKGWPSSGYVAGPKRRAAWRVLDAQYFGVPQRRKRVFVVASARDDFAPPQVLFERPCVRGDSTQSGSEGKETSRPALECPPRSIYDVTHASEIREYPISPTLCGRMGTGGNQVPLLLSENGTDRAITEGFAPPVKSSTPIYLLAENTIERQPQNGGNGSGYNEDICYTLNATGVHGVCKGKIVRKLTPRECERLQGFPDDWTRVPYRGKPAEECPDAPRYKAIGNSWAVPCARWIGERIWRTLD